MRTEVYSWRLSSDLKTDLERQARARGESISSILDAAARNWLQQSAESADEEDEQRRLHAAAEGCLGTIMGGKPRRAERAREMVRARIRRLNGR